MSEAIRNHLDRQVWKELTIAVPSYARPIELDALLRSASELTELPGEILICEDNSPDREKIRKIAEIWAPQFELGGSKLTYRENSKNLGYDGNVREVLKASSGQWIMLIGNDDLLLPSGVTRTRQRIENNPELTMFSSAYLKFRDSIQEIIGVTRICGDDQIFNFRNAESGVIIKASGFVGGLVIKKQFASDAATERFDGTLYYQVYLAALAFTRTGIGYISTPTVASRVGNAPLFGAAPSENRSHKPGIYQADARVAMWEGILNIGAAVEQASGLPILSGFRRELGGRQAFHVFELVAPQGRRALLKMVREFANLGLFSSPIAWLLTAVGIALGRWSRLFFLAVRKVQERHVKYKSRHLKGELSI